MFLNLSSKGVDYSAFKAINDACLVYDGHLVIDSTFHTNDCSIRAAGPLTKFARRYHADQWSHSHFSSREVGQELAGALLPLFDPTLEPATNPPGDLDRLTPMYQQAKVQGPLLSPCSATSMKLHPCVFGVSGIIPRFYFQGFLI